MQKGMSSGRKRKKQHESAFLNFIGRSYVARLLIYLIFFFIAALLVQVTMNAYEAQSELDFMRWYYLIGFFAITIVGSEVAVFRRSPSNGVIVMLLGGVLLQAGFLFAATRLVKLNYVQEEYHYFIVPYALIPVVTTVLLGKKSGYFAAIISGLLCSLQVPDLLMMSMLFLTSVVGVLSVTVSDTIRKRSQLVRNGLFLGVLSLLALWAMGFFEILLMEHFQWSQLLWQVVTVIGVGAVSGMVAASLTPTLESLTNITTPATWLELTDLNHRLLRRMQLEAPGTFHHSLVVAALSESAALEIGELGEKARVCSYFHDIGKLKKPEYFIENQGGRNPHDHLTPTMSALILIAHVKDGVDMAIKHKLNRDIIKVIEEHHGDTLAYYFYRKALKQKEESEKEALDDDVEVNRSNFQYPGPRPTSKISGIISLADAVEGASRTLQKVTPKSVKQLVNEIVTSRIKEGQLDCCELSFEELSKVKESFAKTLRSMLHQRVDYPKEENHSPKEPETKPLKEV